MTDMPIESFPFDASKYLDDAGSQSEYVQEALGTGEPEVITCAGEVCVRAVRAGEESGPGILAEEIFAKLRQMRAEHHAKD